MDITFRTTKLQKECHDNKLLIRRYGTTRAKLIQRRLEQLTNSDNLAIVRTLPGARCHELVGDRAGQLALDLTHPYRLIIEPATDPIPRRSDGGLDWLAVKAVRVLEIEDYHG